MLGYFVFLMSIQLLMGRGEAAMFNNSGVYVKLMNMSGMITASRSMDIDKDDKRVVLSFDEIRLLKDANVTNKMNFTGVSFNDEPVTDGKLPGTTIDAKIVTATANLAAPISGTLKVMVYIASKAGNISSDDETTTVAAGNVKVGMELSELNFSEENSMEMYLSVKGTASKPTMKNSERTNGLFFDLGDNSSVIFSRKVKMDAGTDFKNMTEGFPKLMDSKIVLKFNKFSNVTYDPIITVGTPSDTSGGSLGPVMSYALLLAIAFLMCQLIA